MGEEGERHDPKEVIEAMVSIVPADTGLFRNVVPKEFEEFANANEKEAWENRICERSRKVKTCYRLVIRHSSMLSALPTKVRTSPFQRAA